MCEIYQTKIPVEKIVKLLKNHCSFWSKGPDFETPSISCLYGILLYVYILSILAKQSFSVKCATMGMFCIVPLCPVSTSSKYALTNIHVKFTVCLQHVYSIKFLKWNSLQPLIILTVNTDHNTTKLKI